VSSGVIGYKTNGSYCITTNAGVRLTYRNDTIRNSVVCTANSITLSRAKANSSVEDSATESIQYAFRINESGFYYNIGGTWSQINFAGGGSGTITAVWG
jgi:hypothetical protein